MTPEERVRNDIETGITSVWAGGNWRPVVLAESDDASLIEATANDIRAAIAEAVVEERERCAKVAESVSAEQAARQTRPAIGLSATAYEIRKGSNE